jgi:hypothetical protein
VTGLESMSQPRYMPFSNRQGGRGPCVTALVLVAVAEAAARDIKISLTCALRRCLCQCWVLGTLAMRSVAAASRAESAI